MDVILIIYLLTSATAYDFYVMSAGKDDGNTCKIQINGVEYQTYGRGHNIVVVTPGTQEYKSTVFDTYGTADEVKYF